MARQRKRPLPRGITVRRRKTMPDVYLVSFTDQGGKLRQELAGTDLREAERLLAQRRREVEAGTYGKGGEASARMTLEEYAEKWLEARNTRSVKDEAARIRRHVLPYLGATALEDLTPPQVKDWIDELSAAGRLSAKSICNVHGVLHRMLEEAAFRQVIRSNPAHLPKGSLPKFRQGGPRFTRDEVWTLLTHPDVSPDRRVLYAMMALGGLRNGEAQGRRWRDLDTEARPLAALRVASQYRDRPLKTAKGEDMAERMVPVHPELRRILDDWRRRGWAELFGRHPTPEDWIAPNPRTMQPDSDENRIGKALLRDLDALGIPAKDPSGRHRQGRRSHAFRRAFISLARSDGARPDVLKRVTHNPKSSMIDVYTSFEWEPLCEAVSNLRLDLRRAEVVALPKASGADDSGPDQLDAELDAPSAGPGIIREMDGGGGSRTRVRKQSAHWLLRA